MAPKERIFSNNCNFLIFNIKIMLKPKQPVINAVLIFLNEGITMCLEIKYYNISVRQHNLIIYL